MVSQRAALLCPGSGAQDPTAPRAPLPCQGRQKCSPGQLCPQCWHREVASRIRPAWMWFHSLLCEAVSVCCFSHHPWSTAAVRRGELSLQHWLGILQSALPVSSLPPLAPEISFPTDAFHAGMWICFLWPFCSNLLSLRSGLPALCSWALVLVPNTTLGSVYSLNLNPAEDKSSPALCSSVWLYVLGFIH